jgi:transcriptional regulator NrdR family protein
MTSYELLNKIIEENKFEITTPINIEKIAEILNINILHDNFFEIIEPFRFEKIAGKFNILINKHEISDQRIKNFIVSLGIMKKCNENRNINDEELKKYAIKLLTPIDTLNKELKKYTKNYYSKFNKKPSLKETISFISNKFNIEESRAKERILFIEKNIF